jgi:hypothetical protein
MKNIRSAIVLALAAFAIRALASPTPPEHPTGPNIPKIPTAKIHQSGKRDGYKKKIQPARYQRPEQKQRQTHPAKSNPRTIAPTVKGVVASEFRMNTDSLPFNYGRNYATAAMQDDGTIISVWADGRSGTDNIYFQRFNRQGFPLGPAQAADAYNTYQEYPAIAVGDNGAFAIVWDDYRVNDGYARIYCRLFDSGGNPLGSTYRVDDYDGISVKYRPAVTATDSGFAVDWEEWRNSQPYNVHLRLLDTLGVPLGASVFMTSNTSNDKYSVDISRIEKGFVTTWLDRRSGNDDIYARIYSANGDTIGPEFKVNDNSTWYRSEPKVCGTDSGFTVVWYDYRSGSYYDIYLQRYDTLGVALGGNFQVTNTIAYAQAPSIAHRQGQTVVTWYDDRNGTGDVFAQWFKPNGDTLGGQVMLNDDASGQWQYNPSAAAGDSGWAMVWMDQRNSSIGNGELYGQCYDTTLSATGANFFACDSIFGLHDQYDPSVASSENGNFLAVWYDYRFDDVSGDICDIFGRLYNKDGNALTPDFLISDTSYSSSQRYAYDPKAVCLADGSYLVAWYDYRNGIDYDIYGQKLDGTGNLVGGNYLISGTPAGYKDYNLSLASSDSGFGVFWYAYDPSWSFPNIYGRLFKTNGDSIGTTCVITDASASYPYAYNPCAAATDSGVMVVWEEYLNGNNNYYIYGRRMLWDGSLAGGRITIGDSISYDQYDPAIAGTNQGFLVAWYDYRDGNDAIYGQYLDAVGQKVDSTFVISTDSANYHYEPSVTVSQDGDRYAVFWYSENSISGTEWLTSQRYLGGLPQGVNETVVDSLNWRWMSTYGASNIASSEDRLFFTFYGQNGVTGSDVFGKITDWYSVSEPPSAIAQIFPPNDTLLGDSTVSFIWTNATAGTYAIGGYRLQVSADSAMSSYCLDTLVSDTFLTVALPSADTMFYWRVRAVDIYGYQGAITTARYFKLDAVSPATPTLITPANNSWLATDTAFCTWSAVTKSGKASPVYYILKAYLLPDTTSPVITDTTYQTGDTLLIGQGRYRWLVEAHDEAGNTPGISGYYNFGYDWTPPVSPIIQISPTDSLITNQSNVTFCWHPSTDAVSGIREYAVLYAYDESFSSGVVETTLTDTSIVLSLPDSIYYWMVEARDTVGNVGVSYVWQLNVDTHDPAVPTLISPVNNHWLGDTAVAFVWDQVTKKAKASEVSYVIQLDTNNTFASPLIEDTTIVSVDTFGLSEGQYYWRVMAYDAAGNYGTYSAYRTFGIDTTAPLFQDVKTLPDDDMAPYGPYEVTSKVYDLSGVKAGWLYRQVNGGSWDSTAMFFASDSLRDSIPELTPTIDETLSVSYYIKATDMLDHQTTSSTYSFKVIGPSGVSGKPERSMPTVYALDNAYPNPSRGQTTFKYQLPKESNVSLTVYNVVGQQIKQFDIGTKPAGYHLVNWNDNTLPNGVYIYQLKAGTFSSTKKLMIVR